MFPNIKYTRVALDLSGNPPPLQPKMLRMYTTEDWDLNNKIKFRISNENERLGERIVQESTRAMDAARDSGKQWRLEVEHNMRERVSEIRFLIDELNKQRKIAMLEEEALTTYRDRVLNAIDFLKEKSLAICQQCLIWREGRLGPELCDDDVNRQLRQELKVIKGCQQLMNRVLKEAEVQIVKLRAAIYLLDEDLTQKEKSLLIDESNLKLRESMQNLGADMDMTQLNCYYTLHEWEHQTHHNLETNARELNSANQLRAYIDLLLRQVCEDMKNQTDLTNEAFVRRVAEVKEIKANLEQKHSDTGSHIVDMQRNVQDLELEMEHRQRSLTLCKARLANRARRPGIELTCDYVQDNLYAEKKNLDASICELKLKITESKATLRYLMRAQIMQEEEINIKANSIKIDEVDCMTLREALKYQSF